jgi:hypothetical protein
MNHVKVKDYKILSDEIRGRGQKRCQRKASSHYSFENVTGYDMLGLLDSDSGTLTTPLVVGFINKHDLAILHAMFASNFLQISYLGRPCSVIPVMQPTCTSINGQA